MLIVYGCQFNVTGKEKLNLWKYILHIYIHTNFYALASFDFQKILYT